jgi:hypothetical protein
MKWISKHLNWTAFFGMLICYALSWLITKLFLVISGLAYIPYPGTTYYPPDKYLCFDCPDFTARFLIDIFVVFSFPLFTWILRKKNRSYLFILFFLAPLLMSIRSTATNLIIFLVPIWLAGFIILLKLKNKSTEVQDTQDKT